MTDAMAAASGSARALTIKLRAESWAQLSRMVERDLSRNQLFLKSSKPPPLGTEIRISLTLPSGTTIDLDGRVARHVPPGERGPGVDLLLAKLPASTLLLVENALAAAGLPVAPRQAATDGAKPVAAPKAPAGAPKAGAPKAGAPKAAAPAPAPAPAPTDDGIDISDEPEAAAAEAELVGALEAELTGLRALNPFQVLGLGYEVTDQQVRAAFNDLTKKYHPDRFARFESERARALAGEIFILVRDAYRKLADAQTREITRTALKAPASRSGRPTPGVGTSQVSPPPTPGAPSPPASPAGAGARPPSAPPRSQPPPLPADATGAIDPSKVLSFRSSGAHPLAGAPPAPPPPPPPSKAARPGPPPPPAPPEPPTSGLSADALFGDVASPASPPAGAPSPKPLDLGVSPMLARAEQLLDAGRFEEAALAYDAATRSHPTDRHARVGRELARGLQKLVEGDRINAAQFFEAALEIDPMNERAARELAAMRRAATDARKGLLGKLLGKKT